MAHPNFAAPSPDGNPLASLMHRMSRKQVEIEQTPEAFTDAQFDTIRRGALALAQSAGRALTARRGPR